MSSLTSFLTEQPQGSALLPAMGWVEPVIHNGRLEERIRLPYQVEMAVRT